MTRGRNDTGFFSVLSIGPYLPKMDALLPVIELQSPIKFMPVENRKEPLKFSGVRSQQADLPAHEVLHVKWFILIRCNSYI